MCEMSDFVGTDSLPCKKGHWYCSGCQEEITKKRPGRPDSNNPGRKIHHGCRVSKIRDNDLNYGQHRSISVVPPRCGSKRKVPPPHQEVEIIKKIKPSPPSRQFEGYEEDVLFNALSRAATFSLHRSLLIS